MNTKEYTSVFYDIKINHATGNQIDLNQFKGKPLLIVNVASKCGFTRQYNALQDIYEKYAPDGLIVIGIPTNDYANQEPGTNAEILSFLQHRIRCYLSNNRKGKLKNQYSSYF